MRVKNIFLLKNFSTFLTETVHLSLFGYKILMVLRNDNIISHLALSCSGLVLWALAQAHSAN
ncbi:MAG: hypothetical protein A3G99_01450 [Candidatus Zambryskibacteria bacterium RIFCSPLOWO2_12_FULL_39_23]|uniref:Uncharacterized protein n=1 Tax=Candidatus Zambryskibacteria bacterium RIFCSPLOWO2_12_FULL_39_23 TaxID=1802776 RepID=A0A1G2UTH9_9BACT|nr:MAG: hypothetical protein A3G99_01450 [Candidatus Zambryskibacteria bacterium RIFCSPLOWO2_12_FULL_39_23]